VLQSTFLRIYSSIDSFRFDSEFTTWVHRIAVNESLQFLRRIRRHPLVHLDRGSMDRHAALTGNRQELQDLFEVAFSRIDPESQAILHLREVEGAGYDVLAGILAIPAGTVGSRLNKARRELRGQLLSLGWEE
jgi:RNA polymerase sigma-70 factor (ECF subfamily)